MGPDWVQPSGLNLDVHCVCQHAVWAAVFLVWAAYVGCMCCQWVLRASMLHCHVLHAALMGEGGTPVHGGMAKLAASTGCELGV